MYTAGRMLEILSRSDDPSAVLKGLPNSFNTPEINVPCAEGEHHEVVKQLKTVVTAADLPGVLEINTIDGMRFEYADGFGLIRPSNTTPVLVLRFEGHTPEALERIQHDVLAQLKRVKPDARFAAGH